MNHRGRYYGRVNKSYLVSIMNSLDPRYRLVNTQKIANIEKANKKDLESRAKNS
jgi:hypothetical protein